MPLTAPRKIICYTGINAKKSRKHSVRNFKRITRKSYAKKLCKIIKCPKRNNIKKWVNFFGAEYTTPEECDKSVKAYTARVRADGSFVSGDQRGIQYGHGLATDP